MNIKITNMNLKNYNDTLYILKNLNDYQSSICYVGNCDEFINELEKTIKDKNIKYVRKHINYLNSLEIEESDVLIIDDAEAKCDKSLIYVINYLCSKKKQVIMNYKNKLNNDLVKVFNNKNYIISNFREEL